MTTTASSESTRVVLVDDSEELRFLLRRSLDRTSDFTVVAEAGDGTAAIEAVTEHEPDLVLLDVAMPGMDGLQALVTVRENFPDTVVVMLSGFNEEKVGEQTLRMGAHAYLTKGGGMAQLVAQLRGIMGRSD